MSDHYSSELQSTQLPPRSIEGALIRSALGALVFSFVTAVAGPIAGSIAAAIVTQGGGDGGAGGAVA